MKFVLINGYLIIIIHYALYVDNILIIIKLNFNDYLIIFYDNNFINLYILIYL